MNTNMNIAYIHAHKAQISNRWVWWWVSENGRVKLGSTRPALKDRNRFREQKYSGWLVLPFTVFVTFIFLTIHLKTRALPDLLLFHGGLNSPFFASFRNTQDLKWAVNKTISQHGLQLAPQFVVKSLVTLLLWVCSFTNVGLYGAKSVHGLWTEITMDTTCMTLNAQLKSRIERSNFFLIVRNGYLIQIW